MRGFKYLKTFGILFLTAIIQSCFGQENLKLMRQMIFEKTNELRILAGHSALKPLDSLMDLAQDHSKNMVEYDLDFIPGEALADLCDVLVKYPRYHHIAEDLVHTLNTEYNMTV